MITFSDEIKVTLMGVHASDLEIVNAARVSFDTQHSELTEGDTGLINFLMREHHGTPFEHGYFKFLIEAPIFVFREWHRHRAGHSYNEMSGRYVELKPKFYLPETARVQVGKPGNYTFVAGSEGDDNARLLREGLRSSYTSSWDIYQRLLKGGIAKEQARLCLPVAIFSKMIWSCNPRSMMHFLALRTGLNAMKEIRMAAEKVEQEFAGAMPMTYAAWQVNGRKAP